MTRHPGYQEAVKNLVSRRWLRAAEALIGADTTVAGALAGRRLGKLLSLDEEIAGLPLHPPDGGAPVRRSEDSWGGSGRSRPPGSRSPRPAPAAP